MKKIIERVPIPLSGVMLGAAALGNLLQGYSWLLRYICGMISFVLLILLILKLILFSKEVKEELRQPIPASVFSTFPMGLMLLSVYAKPLLGNICLAVWYAAILLHMLHILYFTYQFILKLDIKKVFASYFVVYVGINAIGITAPAYGKEAIGTIAFIIGFICCLLLLPLISYRYIRYKDVADSAKPLACIFASPGGLCLTSYLQSVPNKDVRMVIFLMLLEGVLYIVAITWLMRCLKLKFYPSYASFTFPFVISATATKCAAAWFAGRGMPQSYLSYIALIQTVIAVVLVIYTLTRYVISLLRAY